MQKIIYIAIFLILAISCEKDNEIISDNSNPRTIDTIETIKEIYGNQVIVGKVLDQSLNPIADVKVYYGEQIITTNSAGEYELEGVLAGVNRRIWFSKEGYVTNQKIAEIKENIPNRLDAALFKIDLIEELDQDGGIIEGDNFTIEFAPNSFVTDSDNSIIEGSVTIEATSFLPDDTGFGLAFPGDFSGVNINGDKVPLISYGFINVELSDKAGNKVQLAKGKKAKIQIKAPNNAPTEIPLWFYDYGKGEWIEEGKGYLENGFYHGEVEHFSTWNWDVSGIYLVRIKGRVIDLDGNPIENALVEQNNIRANFLIKTHTNEDGEFELTTLPNSPVRVEAYFGLYGSTVVENTSTNDNSVAKDLGDIQINTSIDNILPPQINASDIVITRGKTFYIRGRYFGFAYKQGQLKEGYILRLNGEEISFYEWRDDYLRFLVPNDIPNEGILQIERGGYFSKEIHYTEGGWDCRIEGINYDYNQFEIYRVDLEDGFLPDCVGNLRNLKKVNFSYAGLDSLPKNFGNLIELEILRLYVNELSSVGDEITNLRDLQKAELYENNIEVLSDKIGDLKNLENLDLHKNKITNLPESIGDLERLEILKLSYNSISRLPSSMKNLKRLQSIVLDNNSFTIFPEIIFDIENLLSFDLSDNSIDEIPNNLGDLKKLVSLNIDGNNLTGLPNSIVTLSNLAYIDLEDNEITELPEEIGNLKRLKHLRLNRNKIGKLPESIGNLRENLELLTLTGNPISSAERARLTDLLPNTQIFW